MPNSQLNKLKSGIKNVNEGTLNLSSNVTGNSNEEANFPHKVLITNTQLSRLHKGFANIKLSKTGQSKKIRSIFRQTFKTIVKICFFSFLMENVVKLLAKSVLIPLRLTAAALAIDIAI